MRGEYTLFDRLPEQYADILPSVEDIERRIGIIETEKNKK